VALLHTQTGKGGSARVVFLGGSGGRHTGVSAIVLGHPQQVSCNMQLYICVQRPCSASLLLASLITAASHFLHHSYLNVVCCRLCLQGH
jgi:hypothetical protein